MVDVRSVCGRCCSICGRCVVIVRSVNAPCALYVLSIRGPCALSVWSIRGRCVVDAARCVVDVWSMMCFALRKDNFRAEFCQRGYNM